MAVPRAKKQKKFIPYDDEIRKIMRANQVGTAIALYWLHAEYGWGRTKRLPGFFDKFIENMEYCHALSKAYDKSGAKWNSAFLLKRLQKYTDKRLFNVINIKDSYSREAHQLVFAAYLKTAVDYEFSRKKVNDFVEAYLALLDEVVRPGLNFGGGDMIQWSKEETGVDVEKIMSWN